jgi:hypothetical protein
MAAFAILVLTGCPQEPTTVNGLVTLDGEPLAIGERMRGTVVYQPASPNGPTLSGLIDARGHYELANGASAVVPPGEYVITVSAAELVPPSKDRPQISGRRITPPRYARAADSGFHAQVVPGENRVNLAMTSDSVPPQSADAARAPAQPAHRADEDPPDQGAAGVH